MNAAEIWANLVWLRRQEGMSQKTIAKRMGWSQSNLSRYENLKTVPSLEFLVKYARALELNLTLELN